MTSTVTKCPLYRPYAKSGERVDVRARFDAVFRRFGTLEGSLSSAPHTNFQLSKHTQFQLRKWFRRVVGIPLTTCPHDAFFYAEIWKRDLIPQNVPEIPGSCYSERIVPSLAEINFLGRKLERAVVARARTQRLCLKARAPGTLVRAQPPPPPAHLLRTVSAPRTDLVRHGGCRARTWSAMRGTASMLDYGGARTAHGGPGPCGARSLPVANVRVVVAAVRVPRCRGRAPSNRGAVRACVRRPPAPTFQEES